MTVNSLESPRVGRPSDYTKELADKICSELASGRSLRTVCNDEKMPSRETVFRWIRTHEEFRHQYEKAKEESTDAMAEDVLEIADASEKAIVGDDKSDNARVQSHKLRVDARKWIMSKMKPKKYGEKVDLTSDGKALPTPILNVFGNNSDTESNETKETD